MSKVSAIEPDLRTLSDDELLMVSGGDKKEGDHARYQAPKPIHTERESCTKTTYPDGKVIWKCGKPNPPSK